MACVAGTLTKEEATEMLNFYRYKYIWRHMDLSDGVDFDPILRGGVNTLLRTGMLIDCAEGRLVSDSYEARAFLRDYVNMEGTCRYMITDELPMNHACILAREWCRRMNWLVKVVTARGPGCFFQLGGVFRLVSSVLFICFRRLFNVPGRR